MSPSNDAVLEIPAALLSISLDDTLGATLLGTFCGLMLYGISLHQLYRYLRQFPSDDRFVQVIVFIVMLSETVHCVATMHVSYFMSVSSVAQELAFLSHGLWSLNAIPVASAPIIFVSQMFFARRVWLIGPRYRLVIGIATIVLLIEFGFAIAISYKTFTTVLVNDSGGVRWLIATGLSIAFATDVLLTPTLTVALWRSRTGYQRNGSIVELFSTYIVNTGLLHGIANAAASITVSLSEVHVLILTIAYFRQCFTTSPYSLVYGIPQMIASRLYANSLLSALNSRDPQKEPSIFDSGSYGRNLIQRMNHRAAAETWNVPQIPDEPSVIHINVTTENEGRKWDWAFKRGFATA
ncbi:hypothetical protein LXA43DRAFT_35996 [Ganoderma leucocontextum]|nr:hypothetical protein LXA43DRAFT_35996 [Ganoderma leucocontextum]